MSADRPARAMDPKSVRRTFDQWSRKHRYADRENAWRGWEAAAEHYGRALPTLPAEQPSMSDLIATHQVPQAKRMAELCAEQPSDPVPLAHDLRDAIADKVAMFHPPKTPFDVEKNVRCARAILLLVARIVGQQTKGGSDVR